MHCSGGQRSNISVMSVDAIRFKVIAFTAMPVVCVCVCVQLARRIFTAQCYAKHNICHCRVSVCLSVTLQYCIKTAKHRIMQIMLHDSSMTSFLMPKIMAKFELDHPLQGRQMQVGWVKIGHFRRKMHYNSKIVQDRRIVSINVE